MANYQYANPQMIMQSQYQQIQSMFPQPQGSVYSINSPLEIGNVPIGSTGLSVVLCLNEDVMYIKSFQNGAPVIMAQSVTPYQKDMATAPQSKEKSSSNMEERLSKLETTISQLLKESKEIQQNANAGGKFDGLI